MPNIELTQEEWRRILSLFQKQKLDKAKLNKAKKKEKDLEKMSKKELIELIQELTKE